MEIVIKIPKEYYNAIKAIPDNQCTFDMLVIKNGKQLPKGHGRLIDADDLYENTEICHSDIDGYACVRWKDINDAPTIIEGSEDNACLDEGNTR